MGSLTAGGGWKMGEKAYLTALEDSAPTSTHDEIQSRANLGIESTRPFPVAVCTLCPSPAAHAACPFCKRRQVG